MCESGLVSQERRQVRVTSRSSFAQVRAKIVNRDCALDRLSLPRHIAAQECDLGLDPVEGADDMQASTDHREDDETQDSEKELDGDAGIF